MELAGGVLTAGGFSVQNKQKKCPKGLLQYVLWPDAEISVSLWSKQLTQNKPIPVESPQPCNCHFVWLFFNSALPVTIWENVVCILLHLLSGNWFFGPRPKFSKHCTVGMDNVSIQCRYHGIRLDINWDIWYLYVMIWHKCCLFLVLKAPLPTESSYPHY